MKVVSFSEARNSLKTVLIGVASNHYFVSIPLQFLNQMGDLVDWLDVVGEDSGAEDRS